MVTFVARCLQTTLLFAAFIVVCDAGYALDSKSSFYNCGNGESLSLNAGATRYCCSANNVEKWDYAVNGGGTANNDNIEVRRPSPAFVFVRATNASPCYHFYLYSITSRTMGGPTRSTIRSVTRVILISRVNRVLARLARRQLVTTAKTLTLITL